MFSLILSILCFSSHLPLSSAKERWSSPFKPKHNLFLTEASLTVSALQKPKKQPNEGSRYKCSIVEFHNQWACSLHGVMIAYNFSIGTQSISSISSYPYQSINEVIVFSSTESNIIFPLKYLPFFHQHYYAGLNCSESAIDEDKIIECNTEEGKKLPPVLFFMQDFAIAFKEDYSFHWESIHSKIVFRKGIEHWILGKEVTKKYTIAFNIQNNTISLSSRNNDIIPFKWPKETLNMAKFNLLLLFSLLMILGLAIALYLLRRIKRGRNDNRVFFFEEKELEKRFKSHSVL